MINCKIDESTAFNMLSERIKVWTNDRTAIRLFEDMYERYCDDGCFDGCEFDPRVIVDNDWVNYCRIIEQDAKDPEYKALRKIYKEQGLGDCSCECDFCSYIEAVDDDDNPHAFLVRC